jgi:hypothetical protein
MITKNLGVTPKVAAKLELPFNKPVYGCVLNFLVQIYFSCVTGMTYLDGTLFHFQLNSHLNY